MSVSPFAISAWTGTSPPCSRERVGERLHEGGGVRVAVVKRGHAPQVEFVVDEVRKGARLVEVVGRHAKVAGVVVGIRVSGQVRGEARRGVAGRNHEHARLADDRRRRHGRGRAVRPDDSGHLRVPGDSARTRAPALRRTTRVDRISQPDPAPADRRPCPRRRTPPHAGTTSPSVGATVTESKVHGSVWVRPPRACDRAERAGLESRRRRGFGAAEGGQNSGQGGGGQRGDALGHRAFSFFRSRIVVGLWSTGGGPPATCNASPVTGVRQLPLQRYHGVKLGDTARRRTAGRARARPLDVAKARVPL